MSQPFETGIQSTASAVQNVARAMAAGNGEEAARLAEAALTDGLVHPAFYNARALRFERQGRDEEALAEFSRARALAPKDPALLNAIGLCLTRLYRLSEALEVYDEAIRRDPAYAPTYQRKGIVLTMSGRPKEAERAFRRAVQLDPRNAEALASLAVEAARRGEMTAAADLADRAIKVDVNNATSHAALAIIDINRHDFDRAELRLKPILADPGVRGNARSVALGLMGDALDGQNKTAEAFAAYAKANEELHTLHAPRFAHAPSATEIVNGLADELENISPGLNARADEEAIPSDSPARNHVFLVGFHRSGTTLLEQVLESHPDIATLEERDLLADLADRTLSGPQGISALDNLAGSRLQVARAEYWQGVEKFGIHVRNRTFVDKLPLHTIKLPLIARLFPDARILFALRDPRDVVLSCFRRHFEINAAMYQYLTLEGAAGLYDAVMRVGAISREKLPLQVLDVRYESLVADFEAQTKSVCDFIGVAWNEDMHRFAETAKGLDSRSPSAEQVRRGLYADAVGRWRRYESELEPAIPILRPWIDRFGYPAQ